MNQRISEIEILRVVAAIVIMLFHMNVLPGGGRLAVEFFAILSGLLMARSVEKKKELGIIQSTRSFITGKIQSFYPELVIATILGILCFNYAKYPLGESLSYIVRSIIGNLLFLRMSGFSWCADGACPPAWYLSSMVLAMLLIHPFLSRTKNYTIFLIPGCLLFLWLYLSVGGVENKSFSEWLLFTYTGNFRIFSELLIAIGLYPCIKHLANFLRERKTVRTVVHVCRLFCVIALFAFFFKEHGKTDLLFLCLCLTYMVTTFACANAGTTSNAQNHEGKNSHKGKLGILLSKCSSASLAIFLTHFPALYISRGISTRFPISQHVWILLSFLVTLIFSLITIYAGMKFRNWRTVKVK